MLKPIDITVLYVIIQLIHKAEKGGKVMIEIDYRDKRPIYEQIKEKLKNLIISGAIKENEKIPSVRELAAETAINPNTIQKAYKELENENYIYSVRAKGYFVSGVKEINDHINIDELKERLKEVLNELYFLRMDYSEVIDEVDKIFKRKE